MIRAQHSMLSNHICFTAYVMLIIASSSFTPAIAMHNAHDEITPFIQPNTKTQSETQWGCVAGVTAVISLDLIATAIALYVTFHCDSKQQSEPCKTWQTIAPATALTAIVTTACSIGCFATKKLLASAGNSNTHELQAINIIEKASQTNQ